MVAVFSYEVKAARVVQNVNMGEIEYLIEFQLHDINEVGEFENLYLSAGLPQSGPTITYSLIRLLNSITDGIVAAVIILIGILLVAIAALCLRFNLLAAVEEDYREIGVMKAIGISNKDIKKLYLAKFDFIAAIACVIAYIISLFINSAFTANIALYMGSSDKSFWKNLLPALGAGIVFVAVAAFCRLILRRFRSISATQAIRIGVSPNNGKTQKRLELSKSSFPNVNVFLGARDVIGRFSVYGLLCFVFVICTFLMLVPLCTLSTVESPEFLTYMGAAKSDIRIDLLYDGEMEQRYEQMIDYIRNDDDIEKYAAFLASNYKVLSDDGAYENIRIETGDFTIFPLEFLIGAAPTDENEIALSVMNAEELNKSIGDTLTLLINGETKDLIICGIYQDITNGGKTAKAILSYDPALILWFTVNINLKEGTDMFAKIDEYNGAFDKAKVADIDNYLQQTLGAVVKQLKMSTRFAIGISIGIAILITAMFFKMLTAKDAEQIAIMRSIGFSHKNIHTQYATRALVVLMIGIIAGAMLSATIGREIASIIIPGVSNMSFSVNPLVAYFMCPLSIIAAVMTTIWLVGITKKKSGFELVGIIFQKPSLDPQLTAEENIRFHACLYGMYGYRPAFKLMPKEYRNRVMDLAEIVGLEDVLFKPIKTLSGGMQRKLEIIRSLIHTPKVLFLDEPTQGLDAVSRRSLWEYISDVRKKHGTTVFLTTHYIDEAENVDRVCIINQGKIAACSPPNEIKENLLRQELIIDASDREALIDELNVLGMDFTVNGQLIIPFRGTESVHKTIAMIKTKLSVLKINEPTLEDAYSSSFTIFPSYWKNFRLYGWCYLQHCWNPNCRSSSRNNSAN